VDNGQFFVISQERYDSVVTLDVSHFQGIQQVTTSREIQERTEIRDHSPHRSFSPPSPQRFEKSKDTGTVSHGQRRQPGALQIEKVVAGRSLEEDEALIVYYPIWPLSKFSELFGRSRQAVLRRVRHLKIRTKYWTQNDDEVLREFGPMHGTALCADMLGRSAEACRVRAKRQNISLAPHADYTEADDNYIRDNLVQMGYEGVAESLQRTPEAIRYRAHKIKATLKSLLADFEGPLELTPRVVRQQQARAHARPWSVEDDAFIRGNLARLGYTGVAKERNRTLEAVRYRCKTLGITLSKARNAPRFIHASDV